MAKAKRVSFRAPSPRVRRVKFVKYRREAVKKLRTLIAMVKSAQNKLQGKADEVGAFMAKLDTVSDDRVGSVVVDLSHLIEVLTIELDDLKALKAPR